MNGFKSFMRKQDGEKPRVPLVTVGYYGTLTPFNIENLSDFLYTGDVGLLSVAFTWSNTPHGREHWASRFQSHTHVSDEDMEYLKALLAQSKEVAGTW